MSPNSSQGPVNLGSSLNRRRGSSIGRREPLAGGARSFRILGKRTCRPVPRHPAPFRRVRRRALFRQSWAGGRFHFLVAWLHPSRYLRHDWMASALQGRDALAKCRGLHASVEFDTLFRARLAFLLFQIGKPGLDLLQRFLKILGLLPQRSGFVILRWRSRGWRSIAGSHPPGEAGGAVHIPPSAPSSAESTPEASSESRTWGGESRRGITGAESHAAPCHWAHASGACSISSGHLLLLSS